MNIQDNETLDGVQIHIVSFGDDGNTAAEMLAQLHLMQPSASKYGRCTFTRLTPLMTAKDIDAITRNTHLVFILGSDNQTEVQHALSLLINACRENSILCYAVINIHGTDETEINNPCSLANNTLLIPADKTISNLSVCDLMKEAVLNVTNPLLGGGIVAVDFDDIKTVMQCGKGAQISIAEATGSQRAKQATHDALRYIPRPKDALAIICNIETSSDFQLDEFDAVSEVINQAFSEQCFAINCSTFNPIADALKVRITAFY